MNTCILTEFYYVGMCIRKLWTGNTWLSGLRTHFNEPSHWYFNKISMNVTREIKFRYKEHIWSAF